MLLIILLIINVFSTRSYKISSKRVIRGTYTSNIDTYQLLVPHKINIDGDIQSFYLPQFFNHDYQSKRKKRDTAHPEIVCYNLHFNGKDHEVMLWPNHGFVAPQAVSEFHYPGSDMTVQARKLRFLNPALCHYSGTIKGEHGSRAALSLCDGLAGYIKTKDGTYFIEPVENFGPNEMGHHLHVIYEQPKSVFFDTPSDGNPDRPQRRNSRESSKQKHQDVPENQQQKQVEMNSNCGANNWRNGWEKAFQEYFTEIQRNVKDAASEDQQSGAEKQRDHVDKRKSKESEQHYLEVLVVADKMFVDFHKDKDYENYILTVMNMVSDYYHDGSTGNLLDVIVVRIIYLDREVSSLDLMTSPDGSSTLKSFCKWQHEINPKDVEHPQHHDIAVLITRHDICSESDGSKNCGLLGLAYMASACVPSDACAINEDRGLILGVVIAHEIGHIMGCEHDDEETSGCPAKVDEKFYHVMSPYVSLATSVWSKCSRAYMTELLENNLGSCLVDEPPDTAYKFDEMCPGTIYDADYQCSLLFPNATHCETDSEEFCEKLYCRVSPTKCLSNGEPPAEGTKCGAKKWCMKQKCVPLGERPTGIDGAWSEWGDYGSCSRSCGGGVKISERTCTNPAPRNGGRYCLGESKRFKICNHQACPEGCESFRAVQCSEYDKIPHNGRFHTWKPYYPTDQHGDSSCILYCINEEHIYSKLSPRANDGTPCKAGTYNMCISGRCRKIGCDWVIDSTAIEDKCGICNGDNSGCKKVTGVFTKGGKGYTKMLTLPRGARNIMIKENGPSDNTLAVASDLGKYYLNGNNQEEIDGEKHFEHDIGLYIHPELDQEELFIAGPIKQSLCVYVVFYEPTNIGFHYEYYIRDKNYKPERKASEKSPKDGKCTYHWEFVEWSKCDRRCEGGEETSKPVCVSDSGDGVVSEKYCPLDEKPEMKAKVCNRQPCAVRWHMGDWGLCTGCKHQPGFQVRQVWCAKESPRWDETDIITRDVECVTSDGPRPPSKQLCATPCSPSCQRKTRSFNKRRSPSKLDKNFFKEFYREIDMLAFEPEGLIFGTYKDWTDDSIMRTTKCTKGCKGECNKEKNEDKTRRLSIPKEDIRQLILENLKGELFSGLTKTSPTSCTKDQCGIKTCEKCVDLQKNIPSKFLNIPRIEEEPGSGNKAHPVGIFIVNGNPHHNERDAAIDDKYDYDHESERISRDSCVTKQNHPVTIDRVDKNFLKIIEVPYVPPAPQNLSDEAYEKLGDKDFGSIDVEHQHCLKGENAICAMKEHKDVEPPEHPTPEDENSPKRDDSSDY